MSDHQFNDRPVGRANRTVVWGLLAAAAVLVFGVVMIYSASQPSTAPGGSTLTGQATSTTGSTMVGAPPGTPPNQTSGQAVSPSGTTTTGSNPPPRDQRP